MLATIGGPGSLGAPPPKNNLTGFNFTGCITEGQFEHNSIKVKVSKNYKKAKQTSKSSQKFLFSKIFLSYF